MSLYLASADYHLFGRKLWWIAIWDGTGSWHSELSTIYQGSPKPMTYYPTTKFSYAIRAMALLNLEWSSWYRILNLRCGNDVKVPHRFQEIFCDSQITLKMRAPNNHYKFFFITVIFAETCDWCFCCLMFDIDVNSKQRSSVVRKISDIERTTFYCCVLHGNFFFAPWLAVTNCARRSQHYFTLNFLVY